MRTLPINNLSYAVQIAIEPNKGGSGYFVKTDDKLFLITAKHVLFDSKGQLKGDKANVIGFTGNLEDNRTIEYQCSLKGLNEAKSIICSDKDDIAVIYWGVLHPQGFKGDSRAEIKLLKFDPIFGGGITAELPNMRRFDDVFIGNDVYILGFPSSIGLKNSPQIDYNQPLIRKGIVAGKNKANGTVILDCEVYPGNSGGPVLQMEYLNPTTLHYSVIGTISQYVPFAQSIPEGKEKLGFLNNSGYSVIVPCDSVLDIIEKHTV